MRQERAMRENTMMLIRNGIMILVKMDNAKLG